MSQHVLDSLAERFGDAIVSTHNQHGDETAVVKAIRLIDVMTWLRNDPAMAFEMLTDLTAADYLGHREPRFEVVYHLNSLSKGHRLRIKVGAEEAAPEVPSVLGLWKAANWMEREVWDLYGIVFAGHPDLRRILLYEEFEGHPLRKDYEIDRRQPLIPPRSGREHL